MTIRDTSIQAYEEISESGLLQSQKEMVYQFLKELGPSTQREIEKHYEHVTGHKEALVRCRFAPLEREGLIQPIGKRPCKITGREALIWEADSQSPRYKRPQSKAQEIKELKDTVARCLAATTIEEVHQILGALTQDYTPPVYRPTQSEL